MKKILTLLSLLLFVSLGARADEAFRLHRYDTFKVEPITTNSIVFVGNSITDMHLWAEAFGNDSRIVNRGNSGARSAEILANVKSYCAGKPAKIFLMIGINDLHDGVSAATIVSNIQQTIATIKQTSPTTKIYVQSILPSTYANGLYNITSCNTAIQNMLSTYGYSDVTYIDLYASLLSKVNTDTSGRYSFDALHLTAAGYEIWTKAIESHLDGLTSQYPASALSLQNNGSLSSSFGARATYFSMMPIASGDVLFFGDEMVKNGEWNELLGNYNVKNRGTNWDYDQSKYATIENTRGGIVSTFASVSGVRKDAPKQILLYTGTGEVNGTSDINTIFSSYTQLITLIRQYASATQTKISLVSLMPTSATSNSRVTGFNDLLRNYVNTYGASQNLEYIDIYTPLSTAGGSKRSDYFPAGNNYLYGDGYITVANVLADYIADCHPVTPEQAGAYRALIEQAGNVEEPAPAEEGIVGGKQYTIQPYGTAKYVVPSSNWANRGGNMTSYSTATPSVENGAVWTFQTMNGGFAIKPASSNYPAAYLNPWNAGSVDSNALGVWNDSGDDQTWYVTPVDGMEHVYTLRNKGNSTAYMYYNSSASELYFNKPDTPTATNYFVIKPFGEEAAPEQPTPADNSVLWTGNINNSNLPWMRIPSIVKTQTGDLLAFADYRYNHDDIGRNNSLNNGRIDIQMRRSVNNGETWSNHITVARGSGEYNSTDAGYGDAAVVVDNGGSGKVLLLAAAGSVNYGNSTRSNPIRMAKFTSNNNGQSWSAATDITSTFYGLLPYGVSAAFSTSGRIEQSVLRKNGAAYNRIYNALCTNGGNYVLYSDDFGETWAVLGGCAQTSGDEAHVVELPNGDLLLVSRKASGDGRYINLFTYPKNAQGMADFSQSGSWSTSGYSNGTSAARCNGDIDIVSACAAGSSTPTYLLIQTAPYSSSPRRDVGYFYKELPAPSQSGSYSLSDFTTGWTRGLQVSDKASAYSSIVNIDYNTEAILFEESENAVAVGSSDPYAYNIVFKKHTIAEITKGAYVGAEPVTPPVVDPDPENPDPENPDPEDPVSDPFVLELQTVINAVYAHDGQVGYPADMSSIATYAGSGVTTTNYAEASAALNDLYSATSIVLPEAGKAYRLAMVKSDGTKVYLGANAALSTNVTDAVALVVGKNEGNVYYPFFFVTEDGNSYLNHRGTNSGTYSGSVNNFAIDAMVSRVGNSSVTKSVEECFGYVFLSSESRVEENMSWYEGCMIMTQKDNSWNGSSAPYFDKDFTSAICFEEVNNSNLVKLSNPNPDGTSSLDGKCVGTFSAPYITQLPAGVKAYTADVNAAKTTVLFNEIGTVVPAHTGVLVYAPEITGSISANAVPATAAAGVGTNLFEPTDGTAIPEGSFILAKGADGVGFYLIGNNRVVAKNKAYLSLPSDASIMNFRFDFEDDVTAIAGIEATSSVSVYDLQGRRVAPSKLRSEGGFYITNGKKIIR